MTYLEVQTEESDDEQEEVVEGKNDIHSWTAQRTGVLFNQLQSFHAMLSFPPDCMHDAIEGDQELPYLPVHVLYPSPLQGGGQLHEVQLKYLLNCVLLWYLLCWGPPRWSSKKFRVKPDRNRFDLWNFIEFEDQLPFFNSIFQKRH